MGQQVLNVPLVCQSCADRSAGPGIAFPDAFNYQHHTHLFSHIALLWRAHPCLPRNRKTRAFSFSIQAMWVPELEKPNGSHPELFLPSSTWWNWLGSFPVQVSLNLGQSALVCATLNSLVSAANVGKLAVNPNSRIGWRKWVSIQILGGRQFLIPNQQGRTLAIWCTL